VRELVLPIERAIPLGLIANELIVNSLKHGLRSRTGALHITLDYSSDVSRVLLRVDDTGAGFPPDFDPSKPVSMGYRLINLLLRQLRAHLEIGREGGASVTLNFPAEVAAGEGRH
jgi:two-component sensor histidine kinase